MNIPLPDSKRISIALAVSILLLLANRFLFFAFSPQKDLIGIIPDDAFYYIQMSTHRAQDGVWTFDGTAPATGFHFLYGYFLVLILKLFPGISWTNIYIIVGVASCLTISVSAYFLAKTVADVYGKETSFAATLPFFSFPLIMQSTVMMESWLVILFSSLTIFFIAKQKELSIQYGFALFFIGLLGSLSRTDYGMLPGVLFCTTLAVQKFKITPIVTRSFLVLLGAVSGVSVVLAQNYFISGQLTQASAQIKLFWSSIVGHSISAPLQLVLSISFPSFDIIARQSKDLLLFASCLTVAFSCIRSINLLREEKDSTPAALLMGCALTVIGYVFFYRYNSEALQPWYSSNFVAPIAVLTAAVFHFALGRRALFPAAFLFAACLLAGCKSVFSIPWPHQAGMMNAGQYIRTMDGHLIYSSWNAGIISYFSGKPLINIDGLTNDEVLPYIKTNKLIDYLKRKKIDYVVDYTTMIDSKKLRVRGGYDDQRVFHCIAPIGPVDGNSSGWGTSRVTLFKVNHDCL